MKLWTQYTRIFYTSFATCSCTSSGCVACWKIHERTGTALLIEHLRLLMAMEAWKNSCTKEHVLSEMMNRVLFTSVLFTCDPLGSTDADDHPLFTIHTSLTTGASVSILAVPDEGLPDVRGHFALLLLRLVFVLHHLSRCFEPTGSGAASQCACCDRRENALLCGRRSGHRADGSDHCPSYEHFEVDFRVGWGGSVWWLSLGLRCGVGRDELLWKFAVDAFRSAIALYSTTYRGTVPGASSKYHKY